MKAALLAGLALSTLTAQAQEIGPYVQPASPDNPTVYGGRLPTGTPKPKPGGNFVSIDAATPPTHLDQQKHRKVGLGLSVSFPDANDNGPIIGFYSNSERSTSAYAGYQWSWQVAGPVSAQIMVGAVTGYRRAAVVPMVMPSLSYAVTPRAAVRVSFAPAIAKAPAVAHLSFDFKY